MRETHYMNDIPLLSFSNELFLGQKFSYTKKAILEIILMQCTHGKETFYFKESRNRIKKGPRLLRFTTHLSHSSVDNLNKLNNFVRAICLVSTTLFLERKTK